jgi:hypothetical protein
MGASGRSVHMRGNKRDRDVPRSGLSPLPSHARRFGHGGAWVGVHGGKKKTRRSRPSATYESTRPCRWQGHLESPKGLTSFPCLRMRSTSRVAKATAARQAGQRGSWRKETEPKAWPWPLRERAHACGGARLREGARDFMGARACSCRRLGHGGGLERRRTARRPKESRDGTKHYACGGRDGSGSCKKKIPSLARRPTSPAASAATWCDGEHTERIVRPRLEGQATQGKWKVCSAHQWSKGTRR